MSPQTAEAVANWSNWLFLTSLLVGVVATFLLVVSGRVKEASLKRDLAIARERTAALELETTKAKENLVREVRARLMLEQQLSPRTLDLRTQGALKDAVLAFRGETVEVETYAHDAEAANFAGQLIACLRAAGLGAENKIASRLEFGRFAVGIVIGGRNTALAKLIAGKLASAGKLDVAYDPEGGKETDTSAPAVYILVGVKPIPKIEPLNAFP